MSPDFFDLSMLKFSRILNGFCYMHYTSDDRNFPNRTNMRRKGMKHRTMLLGLIGLAAAAWLVAGCGTTEQKDLTNRDLIEINMANFDTAVSPCDDFFEYVNGGWIANNEIPSTYSGWSSWHVIYERNLDVLKEILDEAAADKNAVKGTPRQKIGDFYATAMDSAKIEADGFTPIQPDLDKIAGLATADDVARLISEYHREGSGILFSMDVYPDLKNSNINIVYAEQSGLSLPDRDYYTRDDEQSAALREQFVEHMVNMFKLIGDDEATARKEAAAVMAIETALANASLTNVEQRDFDNWYLLMPVAGAGEVTPHWNWADYFTTLGVTGLDSMSLGPQKFFVEMDRLLAEAPIDDWKSYLRWNLVSGAATFLSSDFVNEDFRFFRTALYGTKELQPRWKRVLNVANGALGEALGQLFVERTFPPAYKARAVELVNNLKVALGERIDKLEWMGGETKVKAHEKLATLTPKIGYPDEWRDYSDYDVTRESYLANVRAGNAYEKRRALKKIGQPPDRKEWFLPPQVVNAYYNPQMNEIVFPAAILQPPFFHGEADDGINYGGIGVVIGHEMTHGYDDQGRRFDKEGNMADWWTAEDDERFRAKTAPLVEQFNEYVVLDSLHVNGELTLGENIADLGGLNIALDALHKAQAGKSDPMLDGFSQDQRFFISWARVWRGHFRPEAEMRQVQSDEHSPNHVRVNGPLGNIEAFTAAWGCAPGDPMVRPAEKKIVIW